jgi:hypothetical protein
MNQFRLGHPAFSPQLFLAPMGLELRQDSRHASARAISNLGMLIGLDYPGTGSPEVWVDSDAGNLSQPSLCLCITSDVCQTLCLLNLPESRRNNGDLGREDHA